MKILAIETSCDETAAAVVTKQGGVFSVLANVVASQIEIHKKYGGVVPEVAAREHSLSIIPVIHEALTAAGIDKNEAPKELDAIAVTAGPGLMTSLLTGVDTAKALALAWNLPLIPVNHIAGHIYAAWLTETEIKLPAIILTVSGGHNLLVLMQDLENFKIIGQTRDDAAGEAFDKAAKLLGLGYPGGPAISKAAEEARSDHGIKLPRPMIDSGDFDFSFSGLKTSLLYTLNKDKDWQDKINEYADAFETAVTDVLVAKTIKAAAKHQAKSVIVSGGVSANQRLRQKIQKEATQSTGLRFHLPGLKYTTDNAAMIGAAGIIKLETGAGPSPDQVVPDPNLGLK